MISSFAGEIFWVSLEIRIILINPENIAKVLKGNKTAILEPSAANSEVASKMG